jgi:hypothetical protein
MGSNEGVRSWWQQVWAASYSERRKNRIDIVDSPTLKGEKRHFGLQIESVKENSMRLV